MKYQFMFNEKQLDMVLNWRSQGYQVIESMSDEGRLEVLATKNNQTVLLFVVQEAV
ncbi:hypothetical protein P8918_13680 [Bacillus spizizenii]|nr:hypothetical protein [Bacillus spizizenii]MCY8890355.1 hypothetical protein [Bacillus spizizenii]MEC0842079.1 hypothetical protein [Bacillus spizizenii]